MQIKELAEEDCRSILAESSFGRLGCSFEDQPYVVPIYFAYEGGYLYVLSTSGQKIEWMRQNPKVCVQVDQSSGDTHWASVIVVGSYQELVEPQFTEERKHARKLLDTRARWWQTALAERQAKTDDELISPIFFRVHVNSISGLRASG